MAPDIASPRGAADAPAAERALPPLHEQRIDHIRALYVQTPATLTGNFIGMVLIGAIFWPLAEPLRLASWLALGAALWLLRLTHYLRYSRQQDAEGAALRVWRRSWMALVLCQGALWGVAVWLFWGLGTQYHMVSLILIVYAYCVASVQLLATQSRVFLAFISLVLMPTIVRIASDSTQPWHLQLAGILSLMFCITVLMARTYGSALGQAITLKARTDELAAHLRTEMAVTEDARRLAEEARRTAEAANRAKTQFFAAASHDLRQPLHALQLFLADLTRVTNDPEQKVLVERIESASRSIAGQLRSLLDISRLDMANITPERKHVALQTLFSQLADTYTVPAEARGVRLLFRPREVLLETDPALLTRLLGNLIDNAIKFSPKGTVLVSARWRRNAVRIEVRDNGAGIPPEHQTEIFDEFFQIENRARDPNAGLGLGLAIAHRIARLLGANISLHSAKGHGSVFALTLPVVAGKVMAPVVAQESPAIPPLLLLDAGGRWENTDDLAERARRWGYEVIVPNTISDAWRALDDSRCIPVILHTESCQLSAEYQSLLHRHPGVLITAAGCNMPEQGAYHLSEPVKPARLRALLRSLH